MIDQQYSDDKADTHSAFEYACSASSDEDVEMLDLGSSAYDVQSLSLKRTHEDDTDISTKQDELSAEDGFPPVDPLLHLGLHLQSQGRSNLQSHSQKSCVVVCSPSTIC